MGKGIVRGHGFLSPFWQYAPEKGKEILTEGLGVGGGESHFSEKPEMGHNKARQL